MLVLALDLEDVKEVGGCGLDPYEVFVGARDGVREVRNFEIIEFLG